MSSIAPSIGRKVWYWNASLFEMTVVDSKQAIDATVIYVNEDGSVNLSTCDHAGNQDVKLDVVLNDPGDDGDEHGTGISYATWMPYQVGAAKASKGLEEIQAVLASEVEAIKAAKPAPPLVDPPAAR